MEEEQGSGAVVGRFRGRLQKGLARLPASWLTIALVLVIVGGGLFATWTAFNTADEMRRTLLEGGRYAATGIGADDLRHLNGSIDDLNSPYYADLKAQLMEVRGVDPHCRFAYVMGRRDDGMVFFYADSEPPGSEDYSPPGQDYEEATAWTLRAFETGTAITTDADTDRWGTWISVLVPLVETESGRVVGVFGMDIAAGDRFGRMVSSAIPSILVALLIAALLVVCSVYSRASEEERRRLEASETALRESEALYRTIFENTANATFIIEEDTTISLANTRMAELSMYEREEIEGRLSWTVFVHPDDLPRMIEYHRARRTPGGSAPGRYRFRFIRRNGEVRQVYVYVGLIPGTKKSIASIYDVTDRIRAEEALRRANRKVVYLSQLTKTELANRLFVLHGYLELARMEVAPDSPLAVPLARSVETANGMNAVLALTRDYGDLGVRPPTWQNVNLTFLLGISHLPMGGVRPECDTGDLEVYADPLLERAFQELVHGSLARKGPVTWVRLSARVEGERLLLVYEDDGPGIPEDEKEGLFSPGARGEGPVPRLVFVRELLDITGIRIRETGTPSGGARFEMEVPRESWRRAPAADEGQDD